MRCLLFPGTLEKVRCRRCRSSRMGSNTEESVGRGTCVPVSPGVLMPPPTAPAAPPSTRHMYMHVPSAGAARGSSAEAGVKHPHAEPVQLSFLEMTQGHPFLSQRTDWPLKSDRGLRNYCSIFTHLLLHTSNKQGQLTFRTTLGSTEVVISTKNSSLGKRLDTALCTCSARGH